MKEVIAPEDPWRDRLEGLMARRKDVLMVAALAVVAVLVALALWARGRPPDIAPPSVSPETAAAGSEDLPAATSTQPVVVGSPSSDVVLVHIAGAVRKPGLYEIPTGGRIADAIDAAGGPRPRADLNAINLAELLTDGQKLDVPRVGEEPVVTTTAAPTPSGSVTGIVNINSADQAALETIPDVGPVTAAAIIAYREEVGGFTSVDELLEVDGIGPATLETIRPHVTV